MIGAEEIRKKYGDYLYYRAMSIPEWYIKRTGIEVDSNGFKQVDFSVDIFYSGNFRMSFIIDKDGKIISKSCNCTDFAQDKICSHILACVLKKKNDFFTEEEISFQKSKNILECFVTKEPLATSKEELGLDIDIIYEDGNYIVKLKIGVGIKYTIKTRDKFNAFRRCYLGDDELELGKKLTYSRAKYYFNEDDTKIVEFLFNYSRFSVGNYEVRDEPLKLNNREFNELLRLLENKTFTLAGNTIKNIVKGMPTDYRLDYEDDKYKFFIDNYEQYLVVDNDARFVIYDNKLYLIDIEDSKILCELYDNGVNSIVFAKENLELFKKGLLRKTINNIVVDDNIQEIKVSKEKKISIYFDLAEDRVRANVKLKYGNSEFDYFDKVDDIIRDVDFENKAISDLTAYGFVLSLYSFFDNFHMGRSCNMPNFFTSTFNKMLCCHSGICITVKIYRINSYAG